MLQATTGEIPHRNTTVTPRRLVARHPVTAFFLLAYAISWLGWLPAVLGYQGGLATPLSLLAQFGPALAALAVTWYSGASVGDWARRIVRWRVAPLWYAVALGLPMLLIAVESVVYVLLGNPYELSVLPGPITLVVSIAFLTLIAGLGEEPGWRGFALPHLGRRYAPVVATSLIGVLWAFWHFPLVAVDPRFPHGFTSVPSLALLALLTLVGIALMAFFYTWVYGATQSVLVCMLLHGTFNTATTLIPASFEVLQREVYVTLLVVQDVTLLIAVVALIAGTRGRLGYGRRPTSP
jgi:membrane protease YdiL (CAAX protease family)